MSKRSWWVGLLVAGALLALVSAAQHFGWIAAPPPLLAPGTAPGL
jgi:hypothetical protein